MSILITPPAASGGGASWGWSLSNVIATPTAHTGTATETTLITAAIPANTLTAGKRLRVSISVLRRGNGDADTFKMKIGGADCFSVTASWNTYGGASPQAYEVDIYAISSASQRTQNAVTGTIYTELSNIGVSTNDFVSTTVDMTTAQDFTFTAQLFDTSVDHQFSIYAYRLEIV